MRLSVLTRLQVLREQIHGRYNRNLPRKLYVVRSLL